MSTEQVDTTSSDTEDTPSWRQPVNISHLVMGVAFAGLTVVWALVAYEVVEGDDIRWLLPVPWVLAGLAGLAGLVARDRRRPHEQ
jgi:cytochrome bd-type quinol oxidase subunit 1